MKTKHTKSAPGTPSRSEQLSTEKSKSEVQTPTQQQTPERPPLPPIDYARRRANRELSTERVLELLKSEAPRFFEMAEVVGKWIWIQFTDKQPREVTARLAEFGFHWNNKRQTWQHPCGALTQGTESDPRQKYQTYFPSDAKPA